MLTKLPSGSWRALITLQGRRISTTKPTQAEARAWLQEQQRSISQGLTFQSSETKFSEFIHSWLELKKKDLAANTFDSYTTYTRLHILPHFGRLKVSEVTPVRIQNLYSHLASHGVTSRPIQIVHAILRGSMAHALRLGLVARNPTLGIIVPKIPKREMKFWDESQVSQFLVSIQGIQNENLYILAIATGMRMGEILGLTWSDVDWLKSTIRVRRQVHHPRGGGWNYGPPKTERGDRTILLGENKLAMLRAQLERVNELRMLAGSRWQENDLLFPSAVGTPIRHENLRRQFYQLIESAGLPRIRFHDLRHTAASLMINNHINDMVISRTLGHSKPSITKDIYGHMFNEAQEDAARLMDELTTPVRVEIKRDK